MRQSLALHPEVPISPDIDRLYVDPESPETEYYLPERLDLMVTGRCHMRCDGCWGPSHNALTPELHPEQWLRIVAFVDRNNRADRYNTSLLASNNATVCITGGEPLLYEPLPVLAAHLNKAGVHTTLSTTGFDPHDFLPDVLPYIGELGVPVDGADAETNAVWRRGKQADGGLATAVRAIVLAQRDFPEVAVTVRTLLHPGNCHNLEEIPNYLERVGIDVTSIDWKFYLFNPNTGPRSSDQSLVLDNEALDSIIAQLPGLEGRTKGLDILGPVVPQDRLIINHDGRAHIIIRDTLHTTKDVAIGNIALQPFETLRYINQEHADFLVRACGRAGMFRYMQLVSEAKATNDFWDRIEAARGEFMKQVMPH